MLRFQISFAEHQLICTCNVLKIRSSKNKWSLLGYQSYGWINFTQNWFTTILMSEKVEIKWIAILRFIAKCDMSILSRWRLQIAKIKNPWDLNQKCTYAYKSRFEPEKNLTLDSTDETECDTAAVPKKMYVTACNETHSRNCFFPDSWITLNNESS